MVAFYPAGTHPTDSGSPAVGLLGQQSDDITGLVSASWLAWGLHQPPIANQKIAKVCRSAALYKSSLGRI